jgi:hypothetical protein
MLEPACSRLIGIDGRRVDTGFGKGDTDLLHLPHEVPDLGSLKKEYSPGRAQSSSPKRRTIKRASAALTAEVSV